VLKRVWNATVDTNVRKLLYITLSSHVKKLHCN